MPYTPMQLAEAFIQTGELQDALDALDQQLQADPADDEARRLLIQVLIRISPRHNSTIALAEFDKLSEMTAADYVQKSIVLRLFDRQSDSSAALAQAHAIRPEDERITEEYIRSLIRISDYAPALALLEQLPKKWGWLQIAGQIAVEQKQYKLALEHYSDAINELDRLLASGTNPILVNNKVNLMSARANIYRLMEQFDTAEAEYLLIETLDPSNPYLSLCRGLCIAAAGDFERAYLIVAEAIATSPQVRQDFRSHFMNEPRLEAFYRLFK